MEHEATQLENQHVHSVYDSTASYFDDLQSKAWPHVRQFLLEQKPGSLIADIGCGTGKYLKINSQVFNMGCDYCDPLIKIARKKGCEVLVCDNLNLPFRDQCFNAIISIGVVHHFSTKQRRIRAIQEMARVLIPGGQIMIYVWAMEQKNRRFEKQDVFVPWNRVLCSRLLSESNQSGYKNDLGDTVTNHPQELTGSECNCPINLKQDLYTKSSQSANHCLAKTCCMKMSEEEENRFYSALGRSFRSWFFSRSLDESTVRKQTEKMKPLKNVGGWANNTISIQPSRHCSLDLGHQGTLLKEQSLDDDEVFFGNAPLKKPQWMTASGVLKDLNGEHHGIVQRKNEETSFLSGPMEGRDNNCTCSKDEDAKSGKLFQRTSTTDSTDSILDDAVAVGDPAVDILDTKAFMRYYHVFREGELCCLLEENVPQLHILSSCYDHGNWCIIAEKRAK
uniref:Probable tRNA methyltransferase 9B n=1 Tax=Pelusios castaneus TaxID=367368 RepID=A0A8C8RLE7_9SAUR